MAERLMIKAHLFINGYSLKNRCNDDHVFAQTSPLGWFRNALGCVIDFDKGVTILFNQCLT